MIEALQHRPKETRAAEPAIADIPKMNWQEPKPQPAKQTQDSSIQNKLNAANQLLAEQQFED